MRASIASSLCALSAVAAGCGESNTHSAQEVRRALAAHGIETEVFPTEPPREFRTQASAVELRIGVQLSFYASRLAGLAERTTARRGLVGDDVSLIVAHNPQDAAFALYVVAKPLLDQRAFRHARRVDNVVVLIGGPRVDAALRDLD
jgi:hypothetical protein